MERECKMRPPPSISISCRLSRLDHLCLANQKKYARGSAEIVEARRIAAFGQRCGAFLAKAVLRFQRSKLPQLVEKLRYIHRNPVKRGLCERPDDWE
jgi:hypothetical protein